jgi:hypothetical protein
MNVFERLISAQKNPASIHGWRRAEKRSAFRHCGGHEPSFGGRRCAFPLYGFIERS